MKKWSVAVMIDAMFAPEVEAETEEEAIEKAECETWTYIRQGLPGLDRPFYVSIVEEIEDWS